MCRNISNIHPHLGRPIAIHGTVRNDIDFNVNMSIEARTGFCNLALSHSVSTNRDSEHSGKIAA